MDTRKKSGWAACLLLLLLTPGCYPDFSWPGCDPCHDVICTYGECIEGDCVCEPGYEGYNCEAAFNEKFSGISRFFELCSPYDSADYVLSFSPRPNTIDKILISGLSEDPTSVLTASLSEDGSTFYLPRQLHGSSGKEIEASGTFNNKVVTLYYNLFQGRTLLKECTGTAIF